jgi:hypothetical protein
LHNEIIIQRGYLMKKGILALLSLALTIFVLSAIGLTIMTVSSLNSLQSSKTENIVAAQNNTVPTTANPEDATTENKKISAQVLPQPSIDEKTAFRIAQSDAGVAMVSSNNAVLVDLNGQISYEVVFNLGKVYVDANSGSILGNTIQITPEIAIQEAVKVLQMNQVNQVTLGTFQRQNYYIVQFRGGANAYVSMKGVVTFISNVQANNRTSNDND